MFKDSSSTSPPDIDDNDLTLIMNKDKLKSVDSDNSVHVSRVSSDTNPFSIDSSNPVINSFEPSDKTDEVHATSEPVDQTTQSESNAFSQEIPSININSYNDSTTTDTHHKVYSNSSSVGV